MLVYLIVTLLSTLCQLYDISHRDSGYLCYDIIQSFQILHDDKNILNVSGLTFHILRQVLVASSIEELGEGSKT